MLQRDFWAFFVFLCLAFQSHISNSQSPNCNSNDWRALQGFLTGLDSTIDGWGNASSDCCSWAGINCEMSSTLGVEDSTVLGKRVIGLDLGGRGLKGFISESLSGLDQLRVLNLSDNKLTSTVPTELFHFQHLEALDLSHNDFSGSIMADSDLPMILSFNVSNNQFTGRQPILARSTNLVAFIINTNKFDGPIDASICGMSSQVQVLDFSSNGFSGNFSTGFGNCRSLLELSLHSNELIGSLPDSLFELVLLNELKLHKNRLSGLLSDGIGNLSNLMHLDLSINEFSGNLPDVFSKLGKLEVFSAYSNSFTGPLPASLLSLSSLCFLNLNNNSFSGGIDLDCTAMVHLSHLDLGSNQFRGNIPNSLSSCTELKTINLAKNSLDGQIPDSFKHLQELTSLSLSNNSFRNISAALGVLQQCKNLTTLVLTKSFHGEELPTYGIQGFKSLEVLIIPNCGLSGSVPPWLRNCTQLRLLDLSWNHLNGNIPSWLGSLDSLFYLDLSNNSLTGEIPESLTQLKSLIFPNISHEESTPPGFPLFMKSNQNASGWQYNHASSFRPSLVLSSNELTGLIRPEFGNLEYLHALDLSKNYLTGAIPGGLSNMKNLEILDLSFNKLVGAIPSSLIKLNFLSRFNIANNGLSGAIPSGGQFSTFPPSSFEGNTGLCGQHLYPCRIASKETETAPVERSRTVPVDLRFGIEVMLYLQLVIILYLERLF
ncbi:phytosulfokine receptor 1-like [Magnolia sinica]|uniref:phytosulfokine receptor 1-like n=1 Tax=Magnolia sinica TaxID=86752 RepID=UPI002657F4F6|nr:phytosulfokine receptor 1-like [Magnolia sinica]